MSRALRDAIGMHRDDRAQEVRERAPMFTGSSSVTGNGRRNNRACPSIRRITGRTNSSKVTIAETGFPGRPIQGICAEHPKPSGAPGRMRTFQKSSVDA